MYLRRSPHGKPNVNANKQATTYSSVTGTSMPSQSVSYNLVVPVPLRHARRADTAVRKQFHKYASCVTMAEPKIKCASSF